MCSHDKKISLGFSNKSFNQGIHICIIYKDEAERRNVISKFIESGLAADEKIGYFTDIMTPAELKAWFNEVGIEIPKDTSNKQVTIAPAKQVYCPTGKFVIDDMLKNLANYYDDSVREGFTGARVTGETNWLRENIPGADRFMEYETLINQIVEQHPATIMCQYDVTKFSGAELFDILQVHPLMVVHGEIVKNPAYLVTDEFLKVYSHDRK